MHEPTRLNGGQLTHAAHAGAGPRCDGAESHLAQLKPSATLRKPTCPRRAEGLREGAGEAALGREGAASAVALAHCSRARAREKCARLKRGVWGALVACRSPSGPEAWRGAVWRRTRPDAVWRHFVVTGRFLAVLMPTGGAMQGLILA